MSKERSQGIEVEWANQKKAQFDELFRHVRCNCPTCGAKAAKEMRTYRGPDASEDEIHVLLSELGTMAAEIRRKNMAKELVSKPHEKSSRNN